MRQMRKSIRFTIAWLMLAMLLSATSQPTSVTHVLAAGLAAPSEGFASPQIRAVWTHDDGAVAAGQMHRAWMWGPGPFYTNYEPFRDTPQGNHLVQYFDKGRLEINDPNADKSSPWYVTSGLLVKEMVTGRVQTGNDTWHDIGPARIPVAGDGGADGGPTYAHFAALTGRTPNRAGQPLPGASYLRPNGPNTELVGGLNAPIGITLPRFEQASGHNWADVFWNFANSAGKPAGFNWLYTLGYPITEPYWIIAPVNGKRETLLVQLFERRTLTYNPSNPPETQVEMGNVGRHYYQWRYADRHTANLHASYDVTIAVGPAPDRKTQVIENINFTNGAAEALDNVVLHIVWNHWQGVFTLHTVTETGIDAKVAWRQGINGDVSLPRPLAPGGRATIELQFEIKPRPVGGRTGYDRSNDILSLGDMLPTIVPYENGGWQYYPYSDLGDLGFYDTSDYTVQVEGFDGERIVVGGTGQIISQSRGGSRWNFVAKNVRDVAYVVSPKFINPLDDPSMTRQEGNVKMLAYFLPEHKADGQRQLQLCGPALSWFGKKIGAYPFDTYTIAEMGVPLEPTDNYAQEYPMAYFIPTSWLKLGAIQGRWTWYTPVHEVGHQWFYSAVGNNQLIDPWLDEAMTSYITTEYVRFNYPDKYSQVWASNTQHANTGRPVSSGVYSGFTSESQYTATIYDTGVIMLDKIRRTMDDDAFYAALQDYYSTYTYKRAMPADLLDMLQKHSKADLQGIFSAYLGY